MRTLVDQLSLLTARGIERDAWLLVEDGRVVARGGGRAPELDGVDRWSVAGRRVVPGFIDLHVHGGGGATVDDGADAIETALALHRAHGTTRSLVSLVARPLGEMLQSLRTVAALTRRDPLVLGSHLEGPFLSPRRSAAHAPAHLRSPDPATVDALLDAGGGTLAQITIAPELPGALDAIERFAEAGVVVAIGHTEANAVLVHTAVDRGARLLTHTWNAMPGISAREPGPVGAALGRRSGDADSDSVTLELIADGIHVATEVLALTFAAAPGRIALVTDAMAAAGHRDGQYRLGGVDVSVNESVARAASTGALAGSTLTLERALQVVIGAGVPDSTAIEALTTTPARVLGLENRLGDLSVGHAADFVVLDDGGEVVEVWADGARLSGIPS